MRPSPAIAASLVLLLSASTTFAAHLEGKWAVTVTPDQTAGSGAGSAFDDVLEFKADTFTSKTFKSRGFPSTTFEEKGARMGPSEFKATLKSKTDGTAKWSGTATGDEIHGELVWTRQDGSVANYTFRGNKQ